MTEVTLNYWAILVSGIVSMVLGAVWYSPPIFGNLWMKLSGMSHEQLEHSKKKGMAVSYLVAFIALLVTAYVLAHYVNYAGAKTFQDGLWAGFWPWLGFVAPITIGMVLWENKPLSLWVLHNVHHLISLLIMGVILTMWV